MIFIKSVHWLILIGFGQNHESDYIRYVDLDEVKMIIHGLTWNGFGQNHESSHIRYVDLDEVKIIIHIIIYWFALSSGLSRILYLIFYINYKWYVIFISKKCSNYFFKWFNISILLVSMSKHTIKLINKILVKNKIALQYLNFA